MTLLSLLYTILIITFLILMFDSIAMGKRKNTNDTEKCYGCSKSTHYRLLDEKNGFNETISEKLIKTTPISWGSSNNKITSAINTTIIIELEPSITYTDGKEPEESTIPAVRYLNGTEKGTSKAISITKNVSSTEQSENYEPEVTTLAPAGRRFLNDERTKMNNTAMKTETKNSKINNREVIKSNITKTKPLRETTKSNVTVFNIPKLKLIKEMMKPKKHILNKFGSVSRNLLVEKTSSNVTENNTLTDAKSGLRKSKKCKIKRNSKKTKNDTFADYLKNNSTRSKQRRMNIRKSEEITSNISHEITTCIPDKKGLKNKGDVETTQNTIENSRICDPKFEDISLNKITEDMKAEITSSKILEETTPHVADTQTQQSMVNSTEGNLEIKSLRPMVTAENRIENQIELVTKFREAMTVSTENYASSEMAVNTTEISNEFIRNRITDNFIDEYRFFNESSKISSSGTVPIIRIALKNRRKKFRHMAEEVQVLCDVLQKEEKNSRDTKYDCTIKY